MHNVQHDKLEYGRTGGLQTKNKQPGDGRACKPLTQVLRDYLLCIIRDALAPATALPADKRLAH